jgi:hypothetical protein
MQLNGWDVNLDPWAVEYGTETPGVSSPDEVLNEVLAVAVEVGPCRHVLPRSAPPPGPLVLVDGVRRIEARLVVTSRSRVIHGAVGSYGVGAVAAVNLADAITGRLPRFVPSRTRDPRAAQNLIPIGAPRAAGGRDGAR